MSLPTADELIAEYQGVALDKPPAHGNIVDVAIGLRNFDFTELKTGLEYIDKRKLIIKGAVTRVGAFSSVGKSTFSYWLMHNLLLKGHRGLVVSTEVRSPLVLAHLLKVQKLWDFHDIVHHEVAPQPSDLRLYNLLSIYDAMDTMNEMAEVAKLADAFKPDFLVIDFIQDIRPTDKVDGLYERLTAYAFEIQRLAQKLGCAVLDFSQISNVDMRTINKERGFGRLNSINFKGSGDLFSSADIALVLDRYTPFDVKQTDDPDEEQEVLDFTEMRLGVKKHKYGEAESFKLHVDMPTGRFYETTEEMEAAKKVRNAWLSEQSNLN